MKKLKLLLLLLPTFALNVTAAPLVNPPNFPLETGTTSTVKPNLMFILDDSGSMAWNYLGDEMGNNLCKEMDGSDVYNFSKSCFSPYWEAPFMAYDLNKIYYNPATKYNPGTKYDGESYGDMTLATAKDNIYQSSTEVNLNNMREYYYCTKSSPNSTELNNSNVCRRNGINHTANTFNYYTEGYPNSTYRYSVAGPITLGYYNIIPVEYCDKNFVNCSATSSSATPFPAPVRWCADSATATSATVQTGNFPNNYGTRSLRGGIKCQKNYDPDKYKFSRYGKFKRVNLPSSEHTNFANWYTYYRTRMLTMKTTVGLTFQKLDNNTRVGFVTINPGSPVSSSKFLAVNDYNSTQKQSFYTKLYGTSPGGGTPLREALSRVGRHFAGNTNGINVGMTPDPVQYSCQQNFSILSTDGYWNGNSGDDLNGSAIANVDNVNSGYSARSSGSYDGGISGASGTLSDVAMYYYKNDLRTSGAVSENNVPISSSDPNSAQHMVTYAISLGLNGLLSYSSNYTNGGNADFENIKNGLLNWPAPSADEPSAIDDLWHATINGRGKYYSAQNGDDIVNGLSDAVNSLIAQTGASAAAATSSPNITSAENSLFYVTYRTVQWDGEINATNIDPTTGVISTNQNWSARQKLNAKVSSSSDTRKIYYVRNSSGSSSLRDFSDEQMNSVELDYFKNKCTTLSLSQCVNLDTSDKNKLNNGPELIKYLRGQSLYDTNNADDPLFRSREFVLGDIVNSSPVYVSKPYYSWIEEGYSTFANTTRSPTLYVGANDGMIHALNATTGEEKWAIMPSQMLSKAYKLADTAYATNHEFYVDGAISVMDAKIDGSWKTVLITGMNSGGKGYLALDITNPDSPVVLWEMCTSSVCSVTDSEMGYSYGNPIITKRKFDGKWVAYLSSGYDSTTGKGLVYEVDLKTGSVLRKLYTGTGSAVAQSGVAKINAYFDNFSLDNTAEYIYAGDLDGKVWKWDLSNSANTTATQLGQAKDSSGNPQSITTKVELGKVSGNTVLYFGTGQFLNVGDYVSTQTQSVYAIKDSGTNLGNLRDNATLVRQTLIPGSITTKTSNNPVDFATKNGWYFDLTSETGERVNIDPVLALGVLNVVGNVPGSSACSAGGSSWIYQIDFTTGASVDKVNSFLAKKMTNGLVVGQVIVQLGAYGGLKNYVTDATGRVTSVSVPTVSNGGGTTSLKKYFWKELYKK